MQYELTVNTLTSAETFEKWLMKNIKNEFDIMLRATTREKKNIVNTLIFRFMFEEDKDFFKKNIVKIIE